MSTITYQIQKRGRKPVVSNGKIYSILLERSLIEKMNNVSKIMGMNTRILVRTAIEHYCDSWYAISGGKK